MAGASTASLHRPFCLIVSNTLDCLTKTGTILLLVALKSLTP